MYSAHTSGETEKGIRSVDRKAFTGRATKLGPPTLSSGVRTIPGKMCVKAIPGSRSANDYRARSRIDVQYEGKLVYKLSRTSIIRSVLPIALLAAAVRL